MKKWKTTNHNIYSGSYRGEKIYKFSAELIDWHNFNDDVREIHRWIMDENIDVIDDQHGFEWTFLDESDRITMILTWSE